VVPEDLVAEVALVAVEAVEAVEVSSRLVSPGGEHLALR